ncbi:MAG: hypothetical protein J5666_04810 [Bacilli bacterium]|nr:hypothetical protein [Bacilli bacterium]
MGNYQNNKDKPRKRNKTKVYIISFVLLLIALTALIILLLRSCNSAVPAGDPEVSSVELYNNKLLKIANDKVDALDNEHQDEKYNVNKLLSFSYKDKNISYSAYNDNYLVNISFKVSNQNDIPNEILKDNYSEVTAQILDKYDYSLTTNAYYQSTFVSNSICYVGRVTIVNHLSGTYIGNNEEIYSFTNIEFDNGDDCSYSETSNELTIYQKDKSNILYQLVESIVTVRNPV